MSSTSEDAYAALPAPAPQQPACIVCVGMAGSGKTTFMQRINAHLHGKKEPPYVINLDPAVLNVPFESNIDIRDSVNYKEVMKQYNLGPNGGIITSLNLFATKVDQVINLLEKRTTPDSAHKPIRNILVDTPGQIEVFVWSASGTILLESLASSFPTIIAYIIDTPRTSSTSTFVSNMLYACSILYKTKLPMILVFNKTDIKDASFAKEWMTDYDAFQSALRRDENCNLFGGTESGDGDGMGSGYMGSLLNSMSLMLEEFYAHLSVVSVSSMTGSGVDDFFYAIAQKVEEFQKDYQPQLDKRRMEREENSRRARQRELDRLMKGMSMGVHASHSPMASAMKEHIGEDTDSRGVITCDGDTAAAAAAAADDDDDDDDDDEGEDFGTGLDRDGLQARYEAAMSGPDSSIMEEASFVKFLHSQNH